MRALLAIVLLTISSSATAAERYYAEYQLGSAGIRHTDLDFHSVDGRFIIGGYYGKGLGAEISFGGPFRVGTDSDFDAQLENFTSVALRFESPPEGGISAYILLGASQFTISQRGVDTIGQARTVKETFRGGTATFGFRKQFEHSRLSFVAAYQVHDVDQPVDVDTYTVGLRMAW